MGDDSGDKSEEATEHRLNEARKKGQVSKSQDITSAAGFLTGFFTLYAFGDYISSKIKSFMVLCFKMATSSQAGIGAIAALGGLAVDTLLMSLAPLLAVAFVVGIMGNYVQIGFLFTVEPLKPSIKKLNPIEGIKGFFKLKKFIELIKSTFKLGIVAYLAYHVLKNQIATVVMTVRMPVWEIAGVVWGIIYELAVKIGVCFGIIAAFDWWYQNWQYKRDMRMTKKQVKDEYKEQEGDPHIKGKRKQIHQEMAMSEQVQDTADADAVIVNPHKIAVAIKYDKDNMGAPQVVAKGERLWAEKIKQVAKEAGVPVLRNVPLAQSLNSLQVGDEVPEELYEAVAEVLQFVYKLAEERGEAE